jgi:hypothetical protein
MGFLNRVFTGSSQEQDPPELRQQIEKATYALGVATAAHNTMWQLGEADWSLDQDAGKIVFTTPQGATAVAPAQIIGTFNTEDGTWLWAWDHPSVVPTMAEHARKVLVYGQEHGYARLTTRKLSCTQEQCWELTALAYMLCGANGAYRGPAGSAHVYMTFEKVKISRSK